MKFNKILLILIFSFININFLSSESLKEVSLMLGNVNKNIQPVGVKITIPYTKMNKRLDYWKKYWEKLGKDVDIEKYKSNITASGVIINDSGYIVTNHHVVEDAVDSILVTLNDGRKYYADVVGTDPITDLAVIRIYETNLKFANFGNSDEMEPGNLVLALGNPLVLSKTVTLGIISAIGRGDDEIFGNNTDNESNFKIRNHIQTDAAINPGNSGGGLFNVDSKLIGINTEILTINGYNIGYGFAIPSNLVKLVIDDIMKKGKVQRGYLGIDYDNLDEKNSRRLKFKTKKGIVITEVGKDSPAESYNIKKDDIIYEVDDIKLDNSSTLKLIMTEKKPDNFIKFKIYRNSKDTILNLKLGINPEKQQEIPYFSKKASLNGVMKEEVINGNPSLVFASIYEFGSLDKGNIFIDDVLVSLDNINISNYTQLESFITSKHPGEKVNITVNRNGSIIKSELILNTYR